MAVGVGEGDAAHETGACVVGSLESVQEVIAQVENRHQISLLYSRMVRTRAKDPPPS